MKLNTKKIVAREFILIVVFMCLVALTYLYVYVYNEFCSYKAQTIEEECRPKISANERKIDSLNIELETKRYNHVWYYESIFGESPYSSEAAESYWSETFVTGMLRYKKGDVMFDFDNKGHQDKNAVIEAGRQFLKENNYNLKDSVAMKEILTLKKESTDLLELSRYWDRSRMSMSSDDDDNNEADRFIKYSTIILFSIIFLLRYFYYAVGWSVKVLKQKE